MANATSVSWTAEFSFVSTSTAPGPGTLIKVGTVQTHRAGTGQSTARS